MPIFIASTANRFMKKYLFFLPLLLLLGACKNKKTSLTDDDKVTISDFIEFFPEINTPVRIADTSLLKKTADSALIGYKIFTQFVPDSLLSRDFGKEAHPKLYPLGRVKEKGKEDYLFVKAMGTNKRAAYLLCFSDDHKFLQGMPLVRTGFDNSTSAYGLLDKKFQITTYRERKQGNDYTFKRNVYFFNNTANEFTLIVTEPNEEIIQKIINPIDTLPAKHKYAGDYVKDKRNFISVRDEKSTAWIQFFVHFEKADGCKGELKGAARLVNATTAVYKESGNPCELQFTFGKNVVTIKETGGCGTWRDIKCFFEGSFPKKKTVKPEAGRKKK